MAVIRVHAFAGIRPSKSAELLAPGEATVAINARLNGGDLAPYYGLTSVMSMPGSINTIYRFGQAVASDTQSWMTFATDTNVVRAPIDGDTEERTYITSGDFSFPAKTRAALVSSSPGLPTVLRMGFPSPSAPTATVGGTATDPASAAETSVYAVTYVSSWSEEGPPSIASNAVSWRAGQHIDLSSLPSAPSGAYAVTHIRIYRSASGSSTAMFQFVTELAVGTATYTDSTATANLGEVLVTRGWAAPPDNMVGLTQMANGILAGFYGSTVCLSEPFEPYAWPTAYQQSTSDAIVGMAAFDQSLVVGTVAGVYVFTGADPSSMTSERIPTAHSCVSKQSMISAMGGVVYASPDALVFIGAGGLRELTADIMTRREWTQYVPSSMRITERDGRLFVFYNTGSTTGALIWDIEAGTVVDSTLYGVPYVDKYRDAMFLLTGGTLNKYDTNSSSPLTYTWVSGTFRMPAECNMAAARVEAASYPVTFTLYSDGVLKHTQTVTSNYAFRLPSDYKSTRYSFGVSGTASTRVVEVATSMRELTHG